MEIFYPGWNFNLLNRVEISFWLNSKPLFKMTLQLHVKISIRFTEFKFQLGLANPRWNFNLGWTFQISHIIDLFSNRGWKFDTKYTWIPCLFLQKIKMENWQGGFKWTDDKSVNLIKCLQESESSYVKFSFLNIDSFQWLQEFEVIIVIKY